MFERYSICAPKATLADRFGIEISENYKPIYNAGPSMPLPVIVADNPKGLSRCYWGQPPGWAKKKSLSEKLISAQAELIPQKPVFRKKLRNKRCLIPADSLYFWKKTGKKSAIPYRFVFPDTAIFSIAGLWEEFEDESGKATHTFMVLTKPSPGNLAHFSERWPFILSVEEEKIWLNVDTPEDELLQLISQNRDSDFEMYSVSSRINSLQENDAGLIKPMPPADQFGNLSLFD